MVEVDVHTLELEVGGTIVPSKISDVLSTKTPSLLNLLSIAIETVLARDGLPVIRLVTCQLIPNAKKAQTLTRKRHQFGYPITQFQFSPANRRMFHVSKNVPCQTYTLAGLEVNLEHVSKRSVGSGVVAQGPYENKRRVWKGSRTISRILKVLENR